MREQSNKRSGTRLKKESETVSLARASRFTDFFTVFEKKPTVLQSKDRCNVKFNLKPVY